MFPCEMARCIAAPPPQRKDFPSQSGPAGPETARPDPREGTRPGGRDQLVSTWAGSADTSWARAAAAELDAVPADGRPGAPDAAAERPAAAVPAWGAEPAGPPAQGAAAGRHAGGPDVVVAPVAGPAASAEPVALAGPAAEPVPAPTGGQASAQSRPASVRDPAPPGALQPAGEALRWAEHRPWPADGAASLRPAVSGPAPVRGEPAGPAGSRWDAASPHHPPGHPSPEAAVARPWCREPAGHWPWATPCLASH